MTRKASKLQPSDVPENRLKGSYIVCIFLCMDMSKAFLGHQKRIHKINLQTMGRRVGRFGVKRRIRSCPTGFPDFMLSIKACVPLLISPNSAGGRDAFKKEQCLVGGSTRWMMVIPKLSKHPHIPVASCRKPFVCKNNREFAHSALKALHSSFCGYRTIGTSTTETADDRADRGESAMEHPSRHWRQWDI